MHAIVFFMMLTIAARAVNGVPPPISISADTLVTWYNSKLYEDAPISAIETRVYKRAYVLGGCRGNDYYRPNYKACHLICDQCFFSIHRNVTLHRMCSHDCFMNDQFATCMEMIGLTETEIEGMREVVYHLFVPQIPTTAVPENSTLDSEL